MVAGPPPAGDWRSTPPPGTPMSVDTSGRAGGDLSPAYQSVTLQQVGPTNCCCSEIRLPLFFPPAHMSAACTHTWQLC